MRTAGGGDDGRRPRRWPCSYATTVSGCGPAKADLVFNRFWRAEESRARRSGGTGLGLSISIEDARLHGGWLQAWGEPGNGSAFRLTRFPGRSAGTSRSRRSHSATGRRGRPRRAPRRAPGSSVPAPPRGIATRWDDWRGREDTAEDDRNAGGHDPAPVRPAERAITDRAVTGEQR
ncbi:hypothetical protein HBB16_11925 [Pseudonocardia sp. MCCB 268]|nr:hypothetical protein [Pseudonocardia cytotoxica]